LSEYASYDVGRALAPSAARPQHSRFSRTIQSEGGDRYSRPQLSFDAADPFRRKTALSISPKNASPRTSRRSALRRQSLAWSPCGTRPTGALHRRSDPRKPRGKGSPRAAGGSLPHILDSWLLEIVTRRDIPFVKFGGLTFLDAAHVKDLLALLRFVENPRDRSQGSA
jgi:hypothetical protein